VHPEVIAEEPCQGLARVDPEGHVIKACGGEVRWHPGQLPLGRASNLGNLLARQLDIGRRQVLLEVLDRRRAGDRQHHIALEKATNPFLRATIPEVAQKIVQQGYSATHPVEVFAALRQWKDNF